MSENNGEPTTYDLSAVLLQRPSGKPAKTANGADQTLHYTLCEMLWNHPDPALKVRHGILADRIERAPAGAVPLWKRDVDTIAAAFKDAMIIPWAAFPILQAVNPDALKE